MTSSLDSPSKPVSWWVGWVLSGILALLLSASGIMKLTASGEEFEKQIGQMGLPISGIKPLGIVELACVALFVFPPTSVIGAILLTGYMGGAICTHWRLGEPFFIQVAIGVVVWLALALREPRLWSLIPWRR